MSQPADKSVKKSATNEWVETIVVVVEALLIAIVLRSFLYQPFSIPTASMQQTLMIGDYFIANKWTWGFGKYSFPIALPFNGRIFGSEPRQGDVVVFRPVPEPDRDFIKRVIGMPGDRIQVINGLLHINGVAVERESLGLREFADENGLVERIPAYRETLPSGASYVTFDRTPRSELDNTRVFVVPDGHYFMMGDDRDNSADSRVPSMVGYVPYDNLVGPAQFVVVSFDGSTSIFRPWTLFTGFRGERFLKPVK